MITVYKCPTKKDFLALCLELTEKNIRINGSYNEQNYNLIAVFEFLDGDDTAVVTHKEAVFSVLKFCESQFINYTSSISIGLLLKEKGKL